MIDLPFDQSSSREPATRPRLRGWSHEIAFFLSIPVGIALCLETKTGIGTTAAVVFASTVVFMFGASAIYHRVLWRGPWRARMRRIDHVGIYALIAGSYTPFGLLVLHGRWQVVVLAIVWTGAAAAILFKVFWLEAPKWLLPQIVTNVGVAACVLVVAGGIAYTVGGLVYAFRRPDPIPSVFGYHELFHALVIVAVCLQYGSIAFYVLPDH
jgi:hemolysin III